MKKIIIIITITFLFLGVKVFTSFSQDWKEYKGNHFIIYYKEAPLDFVKTVYNSAEEYYKSIMKDLGFVRYKDWNWERRAKIYIYNDREDFIENSRKYKWASGEASVRAKIIRTFPSSYGFFDSTLPHELGHIIFREFIGINSLVPLWLEEGVAMYQEKAKRWGSNNIVRKSIEDGTFMTLDKLGKMRFRNNTSRELINLYYSEAASVVYYLITEETEYRFESFCRKLRRGEDFRSAFRSSYPRFKNIEGLNKQWVYYINK